MNTIAETIVFLCVLLVLCLVILPTIGYWLDTRKMTDEEKKYYDQHRNESD